MQMSRTKKAGMAPPVVDEAAIEHLSRAAGITIPPERVAGAVERLNDMLTFLHQLDDLEISESAPASNFDPTWEADPG